MKKNILIIVLLIVAIGLAVVVYKKQPNRNIDNLLPIAETESKTYVNEQYGFSFDYPGDFEYGLGQLRLPGPVGEAVPAAVFTRSIDVQHCGLSGLPEHCTDKTKNPEIKVAVLQGTVGVVSEDFADYERIGPFAFKAGVEGEGVFYYLVPLDQDQELTLIFEQSFIDENNVLIYKDQPGYLTLAEQQAVMNEILQTLEIQ